MRNKKIFIALCLFGWALVSYAQPLSVRLKMKASEGYYPLVVKANATKFLNYIEDKKEIKIGSRVGDFFTVYVLPSSVKTLYNLPWLDRIEDGQFPIIPLMDSARIYNNVDSVHSGFPPLLQAYRGQNILVGIVDFGIEWRHLDFKNSVNDTRIIGLWDQNKDSIPPTGYSYGHLYSKNDIDNGYCKHNASASFGHGTNVAGIAAGNGNVLAQNKGLAPDSKLAIVSLKNNGAWLSNMIDGVNYIFDLADSMGIPAVVNLSVGTYDGSHDGRDASTRILETMLHKKGRSIVAAAGNAGNFNQHIRFVPNGDTSFTDFIHRNDYGGTYFNFWADTADVKQLIIGLQADSPTTLLPLSKPYFFNFKTRFLDSLIQYGYYEDTMTIRDASDSAIGFATFYVLAQENTVNFQCYIVPKNTSHRWRFTATGNGILDMWVHSSLQATSNIVTSLPSVSINPFIGQYKLSDVAMSITSGFQCSPKIITVGNYVNKYGITDVDTIYRPIGGIPQAIASNSSRGPTRDNRIKPDISATGGQILTTIDSITAYNFSLNPSNRKKLGITGKYAVAGGTSMAAPVVSGAIALLMQKYPSLNYDQILYLIRKTAKRDSFTSSLENPIYGYGKLNVFELMKYTPTYGCRDTGSINYNSLADFEDSSLCIKKVYGCTDTGSINYNPLANVNDGSCVKKVYGCTDTGSINYNPLANVNDGSCVKKIYGCTDTGSINYNPLANVNDGSCIKKVYGCMDSFAWNYNPQANVDDSSCVYFYTNISNVNHHLKIYPNPARDVVNIELLNFSSTSKAFIYNTLGQIVLQLDLKKMMTIAVDKLPRGIYYLEIEGKEGVDKIKLSLE